MAIKVIPADAPLGAEVCGVNLSRPLDRETIEVVHEAWLEHLVIYFRGQEIDQHQQLAFTQHFGEVGAMRSPRTQLDLKGIPQEPGIMTVSNIRRNGKPLGLAHDGEMWFHSDMCFDKNPLKATLLYGIEIPSKGGNTLFANMYLAYERLSKDIKETIRGRTALQMHEFHRTDRPQLREDMSDVAHFSHPVAITHAETGRQALFVNRLMTARINGLDEADSDMLIDELLGVSEDPAIVYEHVWKPGDLVMWDNRCVTHARTDFSETERRLLRRTTTDGSRPFETMVEYSSTGAP